MFGGKEMRSYTPIEKIGTYSRIYIIGKIKGDSDFIEKFNKINLIKEQKQDYDIYDDNEEKPQQAINFFQKIKEDPRDNDYYIEQISNNKPAARPVLL